MCLNTSKIRTEPVCSFTTYKFLEMHHIVLDLEQALDLLPKCSQPL